MHRFTLTVVEEKLYAVGGEAEEGTGVTECEVYQPDGDVWQQVASLGSSCRAQHAAAAFNRRLYVLGGLDLSQDSVLSSCYVYDTLTQVRCCLTTFSAVEFSLNVMF